MTDVAESAAIVTREPVKTSGVGSALWDNTFSVPALKSDMPLEQRKQVIRETVKKTINVDDRLGLVQGELLYEVKKNDYWKEWTFDDKGEPRNYKNFDEYIERELDMNRRKAYYLIDIYETFIVKLALPTSVLSDLEWSKAKELTKIIDKDNWPKLIDRIKTMSVSEVKEMAKELKGIKTSTGTRATSEESTSVRIPFVLAPDQAENVQEALKLAQSLSGSDKAGNNLDLICSEFITSAAGTSGLDGVVSRLDYHIANLKRVYGVDLEIKSVDSSKLGKA
jgi:hypothetical protein